MRIIQYKNILIALGLAAMLVSAGLVFKYGLNLGIDFTGGALTEVVYETQPEKAELESNLSSMELGDYSLRVTTDETGRAGYILRSRDLSEPERVQVQEVLTAAGQGGEITRFTSIGPVIGQELKDKAVWAIGGVVAIIVLYVAFAFAGVGKPVGSWVYSFITIFVLVHDVLVPSALMSLLGKFAGIEVDVLFVMALLAVLGYSVNDTIVVFDRVRENLIKYRQEKKKVRRDEFGQKHEEIDYTFDKPFSEIVGISVSETLLRSFNTSFTTFLALVALYFFGGDVTKTFALVLIAGVVAGTYSSIFLASPLLVWYASWQEKKQSR
ncbi:protein translocase subunit SecF [Candidatus Kaiserbacteria bacterium]|nr:protein translocase subunit SecF [Candidatus Kaiserbacteria bacterium]MCB9811666.1 protein translocase subunit SecF [Candidatus Nomurabacteria bacterium]